ncbi:hypothetical protein [Flavobacterium sp.]|jgi:hypothetical protein|uniref:hypothetical protein n=1 Tax=Flavobacterium sp. TaxID=239 RepID=UPI0035AF088D
MNYDFSIESSIEKIQNNNTKEYFTEVYQTFVNGNFRSCTVMLYSVLICDLVYKLRDLRDIYGDSKARKILDEIEDLQNKNPKSPEWESKLIVFVGTRTSLLEASDIVAIESLQKFRHLSAHPILNNSDLLYSPNKDLVRGLIRNILEGILTNPPFFSNRIFDTFLNDLVDVKDKITDDVNLENYLKSRYLKRLKDTDFKKMFRSLWKIVFNSEEQKSIDNRPITFKSLIILLKSKKEICLELIRNEPDFYNNVTKNGSLTNLVILLARFPEIYNLLDKPLQLLIDAQIAADNNLIFISWFYKQNFEEHLSTLDYKEIYGIKNDYVIFLKKIAIENGCLNPFIDFGLNYFGESNSFDAAQNRYDNVITNILEDLDLSQTLKLLNVSNENSQIYYRIGMKQRIKNIAEEKEINMEEKKKFKNILK